MGDWATICASYVPPSEKDHGPGELRRGKSILYVDAPLASALATRADSLPEAEELGEGDAYASAGSEGGDTGDENDKAPRMRRKKSAKLGAAGDGRIRLWKGASSSALGVRHASGASSSSATPARPALARTRSQSLAEE